MPPTTSPHHDALAIYLEQAGRHPLLTAAEERRLARAAAHADERARRRLIESNLRLVISVARRYTGHGLDLLDLIQEGNLGLMIAVDRYDAERGVRFATYATWWIRREICLALSTKSRLVRLPRRIAEAGARVRRAERELAQQHGRRASLGDVAAAAAVDDDTVAMLRRAELAPVSLDDPLAAEPAVFDGEIDDDAAVVRAAVSQLGERARRVVELRFGLDGGPDRTFAEIADVMGVSRQRVSHLESTALHRLAGRDEVRALRAAA